MKGRKLLMIPGPIEFDPAVMRAMGSFTASHVAPNFIEAFGQALEGLRKVFLSPSGQPFVVAGSGTLAMEMAAANLIEPGDRALVLNIGYFGDRFADILFRYGAVVDQVRAPLGEDVDATEVEAALAKQQYKLMTITQVDTSTGVRSNVKRLAALAHARGALVVVDGVCSVAGEELRQDQWGVDLALTASQKAISVPPGLSLLVAGPRAMDAWRERTAPVANYYCDFSKVLPIMEAYEARRPSYFGTPPVNHILALKVSLEQILAEGMNARFARHHKLGRACQAALAALGMDQVPTGTEHTAVTLSAPYFPEGVEGPKVLAGIGASGVIVAGGLHPEIKTRYFRIGHMGPTGNGDLLATVGAVESGLRRAGHPFEPGAGLAAAQAALLV